MKLINKIVSYIKFTFAAIAISITGILALLISSLMPHKIWIRFIRVGALTTLSSLGLKFEYQYLDANGEICQFDNPKKQIRYFSPNHLVIANHISWTDILSIYTVKFASFIAMEEVKKWLLAKKLVDSVGSIYINRKNKGALIEVNKKVSTRLAKGGSIGLFPEGETSVGDSVMPFKTSILEPAIQNKSKITPVVISYYRQDKTRAKEINFAGKTTFMDTVRGILQNKCIYTKITFLPEVDASEFNSRNELGEYLFNEINNVYLTIKDNYYATYISDLCPN